MPRNGKRPDAAVTASGARKVSTFAECTPSRRSPHATQVIIATLDGDDECRALNITARGASPVLAACRLLVEAGHNRCRALHAYRNGTLALIVRTIGEGARLEIGGKGTGFKRAATVGAAPSVRKNSRALSDSRETAR